MKLKFRVDETGEPIGEPIRPRETAPGSKGKPRGKSPKGTTTPPRATAQLEQQLTQLLQETAGGLYFVDPQLGEWIAQRAQPLAHAWTNWAKTNASVNRFLTTLVKGGAAGSAVGATVITALGCYLIVLSRQGELPLAWQTGAGFLNVPLHPQGYGFAPQNGEPPVEGGSADPVGGTES